MKQTSSEFVATGRRKTAVASVRLRPGNGAIDINSRTFEEYFPSQINRQAVLAPFFSPDAAKSYNMLVRVKGGGIEAQVIALRLALSRALVLENEERRHELKSVGFLTRDARKKERKKYGQPGARKRFQFAKR